MTKVAIPEVISNADIENLLADLDISSDSTDLEVPIKFDFRGFGIMSGLYLIVFKWMRISSGSLIIKIKSKDVHQLEDFGNSYFAFLILSTVWTTKDILDLDGENLKSHLRPYTKTMHNKLDFLEQLPNNQILISNFDHFSKEKGLSHWLYPTHDIFAESPSDLQNTIYRCFEVVSKIYRSRFEALSGDIIDDFEIILWELLANTDQHARTDYLNKKTLSPNTRAVFFRIFQSSQKNLVEYNQDVPALKDYYLTSATADASHFFFEVSVFDSGPGLARRFLGDQWHSEISMIDEINAVKKCLAKGSSSISGWAGQRKGYGLNEVLKTLNKRRGFLKIRSNFACVFRNLLSNPYEETTQFEEIELFDWTKSTSSEFTRMPFAEGTFITMAFPLPSIDHR